MKQQCLDCGYTGSKLLEGRCPACGSANITRISTANQTKEEIKERSPMRLFLLAVLWALLLYKAYDLIF